MLIYAMHMHIHTCICTSLLCTHIVHNALHTVLLYPKRGITEHLQQATTVVSGQCHGGMQHIHTYIYIGRTEQVGWHMTVS